MPPPWTSPLPSPSLPPPQGEGSPWGPRTRPAVCPWGSHLPFLSFSFPIGEVRGLDRGREFTLMSPHVRWALTFHLPQSPGHQDNWCTVMSSDVETPLPLLPSPCLTSGVTEQNSHPPHHLHGCSRTCCDSQCRLPQATTPPYSAASPPAIPPILPPPRNSKQSRSSLCAQHPNVIPTLPRLFSSCIPFPLLPLRNSYAFFKAQTSSLW